MASCSRCQGLMVEDHLLDMQDAFGQLWIQGWRCVSCGDVVDPVIRRHRIMQQNVPLLPLDEMAVEEDESVRAGVS